MDTATHMLRTGRRGPLFELQMAFRDLRASAERLDLAWSLAWHDVVARYRGSILGPFWITLSMAVMVIGIESVPAIENLESILAVEGVDAIFVLGTTGEFYALDEGEKQQVVACAVDHCRGRAPVFAGTVAMRARFFADRRE